MKCWFDQIFFDNIREGSYPKFFDINGLVIEYKQSFFTIRPIYCLTNNSVERLKVSSI